MEGNPYAYILMMNKYNEFQWGISVLSESALKVIIDALWFGVPSHKFENHLSNSLKKVREVVEFLRRIIMSSLMEIISL